MTHDHDTPDPRPETLRERLDNAFIYDGVAASNLTLLAEIEQRAAARGLTSMFGWLDGGDACVEMSIADFMAEIRGEVSGDE